MIKKVSSKKLSSKKVKITFSKIKGAKKYVVQFSKTKKFKKVLLTKTVKNTKVTITNKKLRNKKKLYVRVKVYKTKVWSKVKPVKVKYKDYESYNEEIITNIETIDEYNVISNENYKREENVPYANNDGKTFAQYCNKTLNIPEKNIQVIEDASLNDIKYSVNWLSKTVNSFNGEAKAIFYYAGHGIPDESDRSAYLLPTDGFGNDTETAYSLNTLFNTFGNLNTKCGLIILDACFSGTKRDGEIMEMSRGVAIKVKDNAPQGNTIVISASQGDETAYPYDDQKHGLFTYYLLSHLKDKKGDVSIEDLFNSTKQNVSQQSLVQNKKSQTPSISVSPNMRNIWHKIKIAE